MKKKIYKALSILLTMMIVFSACLCVFNTVSAANTYNLTQAGTYYVEDGGTGYGDSPDSPLGNIAEALDQAINDGYTVGDTVKIMLIGENVNMGDIPMYDYDVEIDSNDPNVKTNIIVNGSAISDSLDGLTTFKNVTICHEQPYQSVYLRSSNVVFSPSTQFYFGTGTSLTLGTSNGGGAGENVQGQKVILSAMNAPSDIFLSNWGYASRQYNDVLYFEYNVIGGTTIFHLNADQGGSSNGITAYNKGLNINIKSANSIDFRNVDDTSYEKGFQIINSSARFLDNTSGELSKVPANKLYIINNISGNSNVIEFTDTVGKYKVNLDNPEHVLIAKNIATGVETTYDGVSGFITLEAGSYELRVERDPIYAYYYVDGEKGVSVASGERPEGVGSKEKPVKTYADATRLIAQDGLSDIDVATIIIPSSGETSWGSAPASFKCQLIITSSTEGDPGTLSNGDSLILTGDTTLRNVKLLQKYEYGDLRLADYDFTIEKDATADVKYLNIWDIAHGYKHTKDMNIRIEGTLICSGIEMGAPYHNHTTTGDINIYFNSANSPATIILGGGTYSDGKNIYEGNINITIKQAVSFSLTTRNLGADIKGSLNLLVDDSVKFPYSVKTNFDNFEVEGGKWYVTNVASDDNFVEFTANKGVFAVKDGAKAYSRQIDKDLVEHEGGIIDLSTAPGSYTVSDKEIAPLVENSKQMLYFRLGGHLNHLASRAFVVPGKTYIFEYSIYCSLDNSPTIRTDGDRPPTCSVETVSKTQVGDYYKIVAKGTIPKDYPYDTAFFGVDLSAFAEGVIFDRTVYRADDPQKNDCYLMNQHLYNGLDSVALGMEFWGAVWSGDRGGIGRMKWTDGVNQLEVMQYDEDYISYLISLNNPNDGDWWKDGDIIKEEVPVTYGKAKGTITDHNGDPVNGIKFLLVSNEKTYEATSNSKGKFDFGTVLSDFYDLFILKGNKKIETGFSSFIAQGNLVEFKVKTDTSGLLTDVDYNNNIADTETQTDGDDVDEIISSGSIKGTVYTPNREVVPGLKIVLRGYGDVVTDENGSFGFANVPVGDYELYAVSSDGSEYVFKTYSIKENGTIDVKLKYDPTIQDNAEQNDNGWIIWVIVASAVALAVVVVLVFLLVFKKKRA